MGPEFEPFQIILKPGPLLNRGRLYTTQNWVSMDKLAGAINGQPDFTEEPPSGWIFTNKRGQECYVIGDGNHRTALAILRGESIPLRIIGE